MTKQESEYLVEQIRRVLLNKPLANDLSEGENMEEVQEGLTYLSECLLEANNFLNNLAKGKLEVEVPSSKNAFAGSLKALHASLMHLTWQANQVAQGDYSQRVSFMGEFSESFNQMIEQLSQREEQLKKQSETLLESNSFMYAVMDGIKEWIVAVDDETNEILYINRSAQTEFFDLEQKKGICNESCLLINRITQKGDPWTKHGTYEFNCPNGGKVLQVKCYLINWNLKLARVYHISDITSQHSSKCEIENMAFKDELTSLYNRRYCFKYLSELIERKENFVLSFIDLDGLKYVNDNFGHQAGDSYLKTVSEYLLKLTRVSDVICRLGGDEFAVIFPSCSIVVAERKMQQLDELLRTGSTDYPMSLSYGCVSVFKENEMSIDEIVEAADKKMYAFKVSRQKCRKV